jgi:hypothetical protein
LSFKVLDDLPKLLAAFRNCGCDPERSEVGIVLDADYKKIRED